MKYKLLALDMDGTTLNSEKKISPRTAEAIAELIKKNVAVVVSTGRGVAELSDYKNELKSMNYGITISGGLVYDFFKDAAISVHPLPEKIMMQLIDFGLEERAMIHLLTIRDSIMREEDIQNTADFQMSIYQDMYNRICTRCDDFKEYIRAHPGEVIKINIYHRSPESRARNLERLKNFDLTISYAETTALEASPKGITKASGLRELCDFLKIDIAETVVVGDAPNDFEILQAAGLAVAMGNATDEIKKICDVVVSDNDHDGVAEVIEKFF